MAKKSGPTYEQVMADMQAGRYAPVYMLCGEESYYIDQLADYLQQHVVDEGARDFDQTVLYGKDITDMKSVVTAALRYPMMGQYQLVICKEMQSADSRRVNWDDLAGYLKQPPSKTVLVFCYKHGKPDSRKKVMQEIAKVGVFFESSKLRDREVEAWLRNYLRLQQIDIEPKAESMLLENLGADLSKLTGALDKLKVSIGGAGRITCQHVEDNIGISKDFNTFELIHSLAQRDVYKVNQIINYFGANAKQYPIQMVLPMVFNYYSALLIYLYLPPEQRRNASAAAAAMKVSPYAMGDYEAGARYVTAMKAVRALSWIREADARSKGVDDPSSTPLDIMKELFYKLLH